ncbi:MAG: aliphatic sulfonate transporter substrate-binding protein [Blastococcus sp.]|nr:aliphatic sulfonate transporter substrate-binding protein [Blastococcus sp.]
MRFSRASAASIGLASSVLLALTACGGGSSSSSTSADGGSKDAPKVRIAMSSWVGFAPLFVARDQGFFEDHGVDVELVMIEDPADRFNALTAGEIEAVATTVDTFTHAIASGAPAKIVWAPDTVNGGEGILASAGIESVADLQGKNVAVSEGSTMEFLLAYVLDQEGLSLDDVRVQNMTSDQAGAAFAAGQVDAAATWEPWLTTALQQNTEGHLLLNTKGEEYAQVMSDAIGFHEDVINDEPEAVTGFLEGLIDAYAFMKTDEQATLKSVAEVNQMTPEDVAPLMESTKMLPLEANLELMGTKDEPGALYDVFTAASEFWEAKGKITAPVAAEDAIAPEFVRDLG